MSVAVVQREYSDADFEQMIDAARPVVKWAGGKRQLEGVIVRKIRRMMGKEPIRVYQEPFLGGGAIFFALRRARLIESAVLSDVNPHLVNLYLMIQQQPEDLIAETRALLRHRITRAQFERVKAWRPKARPKRAARFLYLNRTCFNGLYRENKQGEFNVPFGKYKNPTVLDEDALWNAHHAFSIAEIHCWDFKEAIAEHTHAARGVFLYCDPPYVPRGIGPGFTAYARGGFGREEQSTLARVTEHFGRTRDGIRILLSNSDTPLVRELYTMSKLTRVKARRSINSKGSARGPVNELLIEPWGSR